MNRKQRLFIAIAFGTVTASAAFNALAHDGDALPTVKHFPAVSPGEYAQLAVNGERRVREQGRVTAQSVIAEAPANVGADRLAVPGHREFGRIGTP